MFKFLSVFILTLIATVTSAQKSTTFEISGKVISANTGKPIIGGSIFIDENIGTQSDNSGRYFIQGLQPGKHKLVFRSLDYERKDTIINLEDKNINGLVLAVAAQCKSYNKRKALKDIKKGAKMLFVNAKLSQVPINASKLFQQKYGVTFYYSDFILPIEECMTIYNQTIFDFLDSKYGNQWRREIIKEVIGLK